MKDDVKRGATGKGYKITRFSAEYAKREGHGRYFLALFNRDSTHSVDGWYADKLRHAKGDGEQFIAVEA